jgi:hypothetical protein
MAAMKPNRKTVIVLVSILAAAMMLYLKPGFVSLEGVLSLGYFPLEQMTDPYRGMAESSSGGPSFGRAYTLEVPRPDGGIRIIYLSNPGGRVFGNNTKPAGRILQGCEVGDTLRVSGFTYSRMGPSRHGSWGLTGYRIIILQFVEKTK